MVPRDLLVQVPPNPLDRVALRRPRRQVVKHDPVAVLRQVPKPGAVAGTRTGGRASAAANDAPQLLRSHEVATIFDVTERTVINWAAAGKLPSLRTIGGHLRFRRDDVMRLLSGAGEMQV